MELHGQFVFLLISEGLFLVLVALGIMQLITRRRLRKECSHSHALNEEVVALRQRLELTHRNLQTANDQLKAMRTVSKTDPIIINYQQRIANLEKFKELYFDLEDRLLAKSGEGAETIDYYKERVRELESTERRLQEELVAHTRRIQDMEARQSSKPMYGTVRLKEVEESNLLLKERESDIRRLRKECETIGLQYEELAMKSLALASERDDLSATQKAQLDELKKLLQDNSTLLARKQAECDMLENCYLELEQRAQLNDAAERLEQSADENEVLQTQRHHLGGRVESVVSEQAAEELAQLRESLVEKERALNEVREQYRELKEQFVAVAAEENELRESNELLKQEREKLVLEIAAFEQVQRALEGDRKELEKMRVEFSALESRYIALAKKIG